MKKGSLFVSFMYLFLSLCIHIYSTEGNGFTFKWYTYIGDNNTTQEAESIIHDSNGYIYIAGYSDSSLPKAYGDPIIPHNGKRNGFVMKLNSDGIMQWHTFLGNDFLAYYTRMVRMTMILDDSENIYLYGSCDDNFIIPGKQPISGYNGKNDIYLIKLNSDGNILWYTFLGGLDDDENAGITIDESGVIYISGYSDSSWNSKYGKPVNYPYYGGYDPNPWPTGFVAKLDTNGNLKAHTFLNYKYFSGSIIVDKAGSVYLISYAAERSSHYTSYGLSKFRNSLEMEWEESSPYSGLQISKNCNILATYNYYRYNEYNKKVRFTMLDQNWNKIWEYLLEDKHGAWNQHFSVKSSDTKPDKDENVYYLAYFSGDLFLDFLEYPVISPFIRYVFWNYPMNFLMKLDNKGQLSWYTYLGNAPGSRKDVQTMTITDSGSIYFLSNNSSELSKIYGKPLSESFYDSGFPSGSCKKPSILLVKLYNNPSLPIMKIYGDLEIVNDRAWLIKKEFSKITVSFTLSNDPDPNEFTYILYKYNFEENNWEEKKQYFKTGQYNYVDEQIYLEKFNHYKISAFDSTGKLISDSRIVSIYPPIPDITKE